MASQGAFLNFSMVRNGSLWDNSHLYPKASGDPGDNITFFPNHTVNLNFEDAGQSLFLRFSALTHVIDPNTKLLWVNCGYPLSGQYDHLPRVLFYCLVIFAILFRHRTKIAEAALGVVMSYSATACIHLFVLLGFYDFGIRRTPDGIIESNIETATEFGDIDFWGIAPVVATSAIMLIPMLYWSQSFKVNQSKSIMVLWSILIIVSFIIVCILVMRWSRFWWVDEVQSFAVCQRNCPETPFPGTSAFAAMVTLEDYISCDCVDYCSLVSPKAPLRASQGMAAMLLYRAAGRFDYRDTSYTQLSGVARNLSYTVAFLWIFALIQVILAFLCVDSNPESVRNIVFRFANATFRDIIMTLFKGQRQDAILKKLGLQEPHDTTTMYRHIRRVCAKVVAGIYYVFAILGLVLSPVIFVLSVIMGEFFLGTIPTSERSDAVGSWAPWVAALLVLLTGTIVFLSNIIVTGVCRAYMKVLHIIQYDYEERKQTYFDEIWPFDRKPYFRDLMAHFQTVIKYAWWYLVTRVIAFTMWWKNPEKYSSKEFSGSFKGDRQINALYGIEGRQKPICTCSKCKRKVIEKSVEFEMSQSNRLGYDRVPSPLTC
ncbi:hypothetical protein F5B20DRAFT_563200 [Whalleya microplaca]|nr:hypothetical protein F5B20DRAFT_563200 [Whalleya microplaca]